MSAVRKGLGEMFAPRPIPPNVYAMHQQLTGAAEGEFPVERVAAAFRGFL